MGGTSRVVVAHLVVTFSLARELLPQVPALSATRAAAALLLPFTHARGLVFTLGPARVALFACMYVCVYTLLIYVSA